MNGVTAALCDHCCAPVYRTRWLVLDRQRSTTGPFTRLGYRRHPNDIATSVFHNRADGYSPHSCHSLGQT